MANTIILKNKSNNSEGSIEPNTGDLSSGEVAVNYHSDISKLYIKDSADGIREFPDANAVSDEATALAIALG